MATPVSGVTIPGGLPTPGQSSGSLGNKSTPYALCSSGWCLGRLQTTLKLWRFIREGVIDRIWEEEARRSVRSGYSGISHIGPLAGPPLGATNTTSIQDQPPTLPPKADVPATPQNKRKLSSLWGALSGNASPDSANSTPTSGMGGFGLAGILGRKNSTPSISTSSAAPAPPPALPPRSVRRISSLGVATATASVPEKQEQPPATFEAKKEPIVSNPPPLERTLSNTETLGSPAEFATPPQEFSPNLAKALQDEPKLSALAEAKVEPKEEQSVIESDQVTKEKPTNVQSESMVPPDSAIKEVTTVAKSMEDSADRPKTPEEKVNAPPTEGHLDKPVQSTPNTPTPARIPPAARPVTPSGSGATPPPVPRRAAARGVRNSLLGGGATPKKEESPARPAVLTGVPEQHVSELKVTDVEAENKETPTEAPSTNSKESREEPTQESKEVVTKSSKTDPPEPVASETSAIPKPTVAPDEEKEEEPLTPKSKIISLQSEVPEHTDPPPLPTRRRQPSIISASSMSVYTRENPPHSLPDGALQDDNQEPTDIAETEEEMEKYVSNGTWEERAWIEIARIREEMFWARIGGFR